MNVLRWRLACVALLCTLFLPYLAYTAEAPAVQDPGERLFVEGQKKEIAGAYEDACRIYREVAEKYPQSPSAPSALFQCGLVNDEYLLDVDTALAVYEEVIRRYPDSRASARAEKRGKVLAPFGGRWAPAYKRFRTAMNTRLDVSVEEFEQTVLKLVDEYPGYPMAPQHLFMIAKSAFRERRYDKAREFYVDVTERYPDTLSAAFALKGLGDLEFVRDRYALAAAYYDAATALAEKLDLPPPSPLQRLKAHLYVKRYRMLLASFALLAFCALGFLYLLPEKTDWRGTIRSWGGTALGLLPLFAILYGIAFYLLYQDDPSRALNLTGGEPNFVIAAYALTCLAILVGLLLWPGVVHKKNGKLVFWTNFPLMLLAANYCVFYALDLVMYLELSLFGIDPVTLQ